MTSSTESDTARASEALRKAVGECERTARLVEIDLLDSREPENRWGDDYFDMLEDEYRYRTLAIVRGVRRELGSPDHDAFTELSSAFAGALGRSVAFVVLRRGSKSPDSHFLLVVGALPDLGPPPRGLAIPPGATRRARPLTCPRGRRPT